MCMMLYIGSNKPLPLVPWQEDAPGFHVGELHEDFADVVKQFSVPHVFYAGSHEGCGCGFQLGEYPGFDDEEAPEKRESLRKLAAYVEVQLDAGRRIELFACRAGGESTAPERRRRLSPSDLRAESFFFLDDEIVVVEASA